MIVTVPVASGIARTRDARRLNEIANHPDVRPWLGGDGPIDLTGVLAQPENMAGITDNGGFVAVALGRGRYEVHSLFLPSRSRGEAVRAMRAAVDYIFSASDAVDLITKVPNGNAAAAGLARLAHFALMCTPLVPWSNGQTIPMACSILSIDRWAVTTPIAVALGRWLHEQFAAVKAGAQSMLGPHSDDDDAHDRLAGAAVLMVAAGNARKAEQFYNRWADVARYPPMRVLRDHPTVIDLGGMVIEARGREMEVLSCQ